MDVDVDFWQTVVLVATMAVLVWQVFLTRRTAVLESYRSLGRDYDEFLKLCIERPELDIHDLDEVEGIQSMSADARRELVAFELLFGMWEHAFLLHRDGFLSERQWKGWKEWIQYYFARKPRAGKAWEDLGDMYDSEFQEFTNHEVLAIQ